MNEEWRDIKGYEGLYQVSNLGRVKTLHYNHSKKINEKELKQINSKGYKTINLYKNGKMKMLKVHRLVLETFNPIDNMDKLTVNHIDGNKQNNNLNNLEWATIKENVKHSHLIGLHNGNGLNKKIICLENGKIYNSITECSNELNISRSNIRQVLKGNYKQAKGFHFKYYEELKGAC